MRGFGDMGKRARDSMIRDRFIAAQRSCGLRRHLDSVSSDTPIRDIVDRCLVWESDSEQGPSSGVGPDQDSPGGSSDSQELGCLRADSQELMVCPGMESRVPVPVIGVIPRNVEVGGEWGQSVCSLGSHILTGDTIITDCSRAGWRMRRFLRKKGWDRHQPCRR